MKLSIFTTVTNPNFRGDNHKDAVECYQDLADEVVIVNGGYEAIDFKSYPEKVKFVSNVWPEEFSWEFIGQQFQRGYEACTGDWVIHADLDFIFHEKDFASIRRAMGNFKDAPALSFYKWQFILPDRYNLKSRLVLAVNKKKFGDRIRFDSGGDLCQPSLDGLELTENIVPQSGVPFYNYEKLLKTKEQITDDVQRMARAWHRHFGDWKLGTTETAYDEWLYMVKGRFSKPSKSIALEEHPKYVQETIKNLRPEQWGYSGFGELEVNRYAQR